jgi:hypothetical protein
MSVFLLAARHEEEGAVKNDDSGDSDSGGLPCALNEKG